MENKITNVSNLVKKTNSKVKTLDIKTKYLTTHAYNLFMDEILDAKIKRIRIN